MPKYAISFYWFGRRFCFVRPMSEARALWIGRHLWRLRWIGWRHVQVEEGAFPTSPIPTKDAPAKREADVITFGSTTITGQMGDGTRFRFDAPFATGGRGLLIEGSRTNLALWSEGKP